MSGPREPGEIDHTLEDVGDLALARTQQIRDATVTEDDLSTGTRLGGRYHIAGFLGRGGAGAVYLAHDEALDDKLVALKIVVAGLTGTAALERLRKEVLLAQQVTHPGVCRTYDLEEAGGRWLIKMEYVPGETLAASIRRGPLPVDEALRIARAVTDALGAAHLQGVIHRDLKPSNIIIEEDTGRVVLMDFGIARRATRTGETVQEVVGTPEYMAPEQVRAEPVDARTDLYALGCVLFHMLAGEVLFPASTPMAAGLRQVVDQPPPLRDRRPDAPEWLARAVARLLEKDPDRRPADAAATLALLAGPRRHRLGGLLVAGALVASGVAGAVLRPGSGGGDQATLPAPAPWTPRMVEPQPSFEENAERAAISPDGRSVAVPSDREQPGRMRVYVGPLTGGPARAVTPADMVVMGVAWTDGGRALLVLDTGGTAASYAATRTTPRKVVRRVPLDGGPITTVATDARFAECNGRVLLVEDKVAGCEGCTRLLIREPGVPDRELRRFPPGYVVNRQRCDATGQWVAYGLSTEKSIVPPSDLWLLPLAVGGEPRRLTTDGAQNSFPVFHPDGRSIIFSSSRSGNLDLWELPLAGGDAVQITSGEEDDLAPVITPDGAMLLFTQDLTWFPVSAREIGGTEVRRVTPTRLRLSDLTATPDGAEIIATAETRGGVKQIVAVPTAGGSQRVLAPDGWAATVSRDGRELVYVTRGAPAQLLAMPMPGGGRRTLGRFDGELSRPRIGPDGWVHVTSDGKEGFTAWRVPPDGGPPERAADPPWCEVHPAPAGAWRAITDCSSDPPDIVLVPPGRAAGDRRNRRLPGAQHLAFEPGGRWLIYAQQGGPVRRLDLRSGSESVLFAPTAPLVSLAMSADGKTVYYSEFVARVRRQLITNFGERPRP